MSPAAEQPPTFNVYVGADLWSDEVPAAEVESYVRSAGTGEAEKRFGHFIDPQSDEVQAKALGGGLWEVTVEPMERGRVEVVVVRVEACGPSGPGAVAPEPERRLTGERGPS